jgi:hypothetical protein
MRILDTIFYVIYSFTKRGMRQDEMLARTWGMVMTSSRISQIGMTTANDKDA